MSKPNKAVFMLFLLGSVQAEDAVPHSPLAPLLSRSLPGHFHKHSAPLLAINAPLGSVCSAGTHLKSANSFNMVRVLFLLFFFFVVAACTAEMRTPSILRLRLGLGVSHPIWHNLKRMTCAVNSHRADSVRFVRAHKKEKKANSLLGGKKKTSGRTERSVAASSAHMGQTGESHQKL